MIPDDVQTKVKVSITAFEVGRFNELCAEELVPSYDDLHFLKLMKEGIYRTQS